jgi:hypothetical protein
MKISYSKVNTFKACPQKYYLQKEYPVEMNASALKFGSAVESGVDELLAGKPFKKAVAKFEKEWKIAPKNRCEEASPVFDSETLTYYASDYDKNLITKEDEELIEKWKKEILPEEKEKWETLVSNFKDSVKENAKISPELRKFAHRVYWLCCKNRGKHLIEAFQRDLLPEVEEVIACQKPISIKNEDGDEIVGFIDYVLKLRGFKNPVLVDLKTSGMYYDDHTLTTSDQLRIYCAAEKLDHIAYMTLIKKIRYEKSCDNCGHVRTKGRKVNCEACGEGKYTLNHPYAETQLLVRELDEEDLVDVLEDFSDILMVIKNEAVWKNPNSCFQFNKRCEYYDYCWGNKSLDELPGLKKKLD